MPASVCGKLLNRRCSAFTMIELMVVILIIGILINFIAVRIDSNNPLEELSTEVNRFLSLIKLASEEALIRSELIGVAIAQDSYFFLVREENTWLPIEDNVFRERHLPDNISIKVNTEQVSSNSQVSVDTPDIILFSSGEMTPFELEISSLLISDIYRITGTEAGDLTSNHVTKD